MRVVRLASLAAVCLVAAGCPSGSSGASGLPATSSARALALQEEGARLHQADQHAAAEAKLQEAIATNELNAERLALAWTLVGLTRDAREQWPAAIEAHDEALGIRPDFDKAWVNKGIAWRRSGNLDEAEKCYLKALEVNPDYAEGWASMGAIQIRRKEPGKAVASLEKAVALDDAGAIAHANLAVAYAQTGRFDDAEAELRKAVARGYKNEAGARTMIEEARKGR